jgi:hypothetical protein
MYNLRHEVRYPIHVVHQLSTTRNNKIQNSKL